MPERLQVKFCGFSRPDDVEEALRLGVDYLGFVFVPGSPRGLDVQRALEWLPGLDTGPARRVGVFRDEPACRVNEMAQRLRLDVIQLQGHEPRDYPRALDLPTWVSWPQPSDRTGEESQPVRSADALPPNVCALVVAIPETSPAPQRGTGQIQGRQSLVPTGVPFFLSGGLTPRNVTERVARYRPFGVDVSGGIEGAPGSKDVGRMRAFMQALGRVP